MKQQISANLLLPFFFLFLIQAGHPNNGIVHIDDDDQDAGIQQAISNSLDIEDDRKMAAQSLSYLRNAGRDDEEDDNSD